MEPINQIQRLDRHYSQCVQSFDPIIFADMIHSLRVVSELSSSDILSIQSDNVFRVSVPSRKKFLKHINLHSFVSAYLPDGVSTYAIPEGVSTTIFECTSDGSLTFDAEIQVNPVDNSIQLRSFVLINMIAFHENLISELAKPGTYNVKTVSFADFLNSPIVHFRFSGQDRSNLTVKDLIHRVANEYGSSHPTSSSYILDAKTLKKSNIVKNLFRIRTLGLPLPYFILLWIAREILISTNRDPGV